MFSLMKWWSVSLCLVCSWYTWLETICIIADYHILSRHWKLSHELPQPQDVVHHFSHHLYLSQWKMHWIFLILQKIFLWSVLTCLSKLIKVRKDDGDPICEPTMFQVIVGELFVSQLSLPMPLALLVNSCPLGKVHMKMACSFLWYIKGSPRREILFRYHGHLTIPTSYCTFEPLNGIIP